MDDKTKANVPQAKPQTTPSRSAGVMDVQRPRVQGPIARRPVTPVTPAVTPPEAQAEPVPSPVEPAQPATPPVDSVATPEDNPEPTPKPTPEPTVSDAPVAAPEPVPSAAPEHSLLSAQASHKSDKPIAVIIVAVLVAMSLIAVTVFAYMKTQNDTHPEANHTTTSPGGTHQQAAVTPNDVDTTSKEVDQTLSSLDDAKDFPDTELSDQALGL